MTRAYALMLIKHRKAERAGVPGVFRVYRDENDRVVLDDMERGKKEVVK